ncbi:DUF1674 domain-containing protein [Ancylobacter radicis]|uniref:DUF1674 domain-containing protein n=1 Tax=Ancylobacter radicis TaxID=2836179 RepID=A0ABS5R784_9HYPH|nr:DUF1674 domain-containing protein [Ancylobacter radicis]MBS9477499.1 DUF1674 domain-containing protein [Ancylobacter radicis]
MAQDTSPAPDGLPTSQIASQPPEAAERRPLSPAAARALAEAQARREALPKLDLPREIDGRAGPEPVRYGDWENKGIASDF